MDKKYKLYCVRKNLADASNSNLILLDEEQKQEWTNIDSELTKGEENYTNIEYRLCALGMSKDEYIEHMITKGEIYMQEIRSSFEEMQSNARQKCLDQIEELGLYLQDNLEKKDNKAITERLEIMVRRLKLVDFTKE